MIHTKKWLGILACTATVAVSLCACAPEQSTDGVTTEPSSTQEPAISTTYSPSDLEVGYDDAGAVTVVCQGDSAQIAGDGAEVSGGTVSISQAGTYVLSGALEGNILVQADGQEVQLVLNGLSIVSPDGPAIQVQKAAKVILTLTEGSQNVIADSENYTLAAGEDEPNACLYSKSDLTINGTGQLSVTGNYNHGIYCKDALCITSGMLDVTAVNDGIKGKDCIQILTADLSIDAGGDGIQSNNDADPTLGYVSIESGICRITAGQDGIQAETVLDITGGDFDITTGGGSANAVVKPDGTQNPAWGAWGGRGDGSASQDTQVSDSAKGLKAGTSLSISGGSFQLDTSDDAIHSNGQISISAGDFTISTGDDGAHADEALEVSGGTIRILTSYEGLEGQSVIISGGEIILSASDDGVNAAGGSDETAGFDRDFFRSADTSAIVRITGGNLEICANGDGIDSNGSLVIEGGAVYISGPTGSADSALDYETTGQITGGVVIAAGSQGMAVGFSSDSTQYSFMTSFDSVVLGGTEVTVTDSSGNEICRYLPTQDYQNLVVSAPALQEGETYTVTAGEQTQSVTLTSIATNSGLGGGMDMPGRGSNFGGGFGSQEPGGIPPEGGGQQPPEGGNMPGPGDTPPGGGGGGL